MHTTELSNLSYTNKDFNSIYVELLEYAKKLSYKWDPSSSDESDPGVVLLKLAALIGDKDNYNIDKNILELMPASVTQLPAARQIFDQCGYTMRYYRSAEGYINIVIKKYLTEDAEEANNSNKIEYQYTIPQFTMFTDEDSSIVYTTTEKETIPVKTECKIPVIEGTITDYTVNNDALITTLNLDSNNRLYFTETNIAENGIFITNVGESNYDDWQRVENLQTQPIRTRCYKFGITIDGSVCYIEFPEDIEFLMGEGLNIKYILSSGSQGNVPANRLKHFYVDTKFIQKSDTLNSDEEEVDATTENISIRNALPILNGQDPESIDDAYKNYKRVRDTFNTLVSLKDYSDYLVTSGTASNGFVCDRTNDIQHSYKVLTATENTTYLNTVVENVKSDKYYVLDSNNQHVLAEEPAMDAFDLCVYALEYVPTTETTEQFIKSFKIKDINNNIIGSSIFANESDIDIKSLQHDFLEFGTKRILMIKNKYPVVANIIPRYPLSPTEKIQVLTNVEKALCDALNSNKMTFGEAVSTELIQDTLLNADERIKTLIDFASPAYQTYAVYKDEEGKFKELRIDMDSDDGGYEQALVTSSKFDDDTYFIKNAKNKFVEEKKFDVSKIYYKYDPDLHELWNKFRAEIFAKNVLADVTPLYDDNNIYTTNIDQVYQRQISPVSKISTNTTLFCKDDGTFPTLEENESILLTAPSFVDENNFSSYVKVFYCFEGSDTTNANGMYDPDIHKDIPNIKTDMKCELSVDGEDKDFIVFFWKTADTDTEYNYIKYSGDKASLAKFFSPVGFDLPFYQNLSSISFPYTTLYKDTIQTAFKALPDGKHTTQSIDVGILAKNSKTTISTVAEFVKNCLVSEANNHVLTGTKTIKTFNINEIHINNKENGCSNIYWILNNKIEKEGKEYYSLFSSTKDDYTLRSGEYFIYTNDDKSVLHLLGEGTLLKRTTNTKESWNVPVITYDEILLQGIDVLDGSWYTIRKTEKTAYDPKLTVNNIWATEQQQILIGPHNTLSLIANGSLTAEEKVDYIDSIKEQSLKAYSSISYTDQLGTETKVPIINSDSVSWSARSILNIDMSNSEAQKLSNNNQREQSMTFYNALNDQEGTLVAAEKDSTIFLQSSQALKLVGGQDINVEYLSTEPIQIVQYSLNETFTGNEEEGYTEYTATYHPENSVVLEFAETDSVTLTTKLLGGDYLLHLISSDDLKEVDIEITPDIQSYIKEQNTTTYKLHVEEGEEFELTISASKGTKITIPPLFRYKTDTLDKISSKGQPTDKPDEPFEKQLLDTIRELDVNKAFNYANRPANAIDNPLEATSFLKKKHFYNPYCICEWTTKVDSNVTIHDVVR